MRIVHVCLSCFYVDGFAYQENELVRQHVQDGHEVTVIASTETFNSDRRLTYLDPSSYMGQDGAQVIRLPYRKFLPRRLMRKLRLHPGVYDLLTQINPEIIMFHGLCGWELRTVSRYKRQNPGIRLYVDSHEDQNNSARTFISKQFLHKLYYASIIQSCLSCFDKVLCVSLETIDFVRLMYGVPAEALEFYPLGGRVFPDEEYYRRRIIGRRCAGVTDAHVLLVQSGKMGRRKKIIESLQVFRSTPGPSLRFILVGSLDEEVQADAKALIASDPRISFLGWKTVDELNNLLCGADVYIQPGTQSATMQMSLCARCPVILDDVASHKPFINGNGWLVTNVDDLGAALHQVVADPGVLPGMADVSLTIAKKLLDYKTLAERILK